MSDDMFVLLLLGKSDGAVELKHQGGEGEAGGGPHVIPAEGSGGKTPTGGTDLIRKKPAGDHHLSSSHMMPVTRCIISLSVVLLLVHVAPYF